MTRGILSTCYARLLPGVALDRAGLRAIYRDFYADAPFVRVTDAPPSTKHVAGTNYCDVHPTINQEVSDPELDLDFVPNQSRSARIDVALSNSFGFGGINACVAVGRDVA